MVLNQTMTERRNRTVVIIQFRKNRINHRLLFGRPCQTIRRGWHRKLEVFLPGSVFGYVRWQGNKYGTQDWSFHVLRSVEAGTLSRIKGVVPGAEFLFFTRGTTRTARALKWLRQLEAQDFLPEYISPNYWRHAHNAFQTGQTPHPLTELQSRIIWRSEQC